MNNFTLIEKKKTTAFKKDVYLLGKWKSGETFWLEESTWDCDWYWSFGYIETYTNPEGPPARDISSHSHYDSVWFKKQEFYDLEKNCWRLGDKYFNIISDHPDVIECTLTEQEQWTLSELMKTGYILKEAAELYYRGGSHFAENPCSLKDLELAKRMNTVELPRIFTAIENLLTPYSIEKEKQ